MRFSEHYQLGRTQPHLDFVDIRLDTDIPVFLDPTAIKSLVSPWGHECKSLLQTYFESVLTAINSGDDQGAIGLLSCLNERNEFHLGYSRGRSRGHAFGAKSAETVWGALAESRAAQSGLLKDLEDTCLLIKGIDRDMISDAVCNILRGPLIRYTQDMCTYYGVPLMPNVASGPVWDPVTGNWNESFVDLPVTDEGKVVLVPKVFVRHRIAYGCREYYTHYLLPEMQAEEISAGGSLVRLLKDGTPRVTKKDLRARYGSDKLAVVRETIKRPHVLDDYKHEKEEKTPPPLSHEGFQEIANASVPDWDALLEELDSINPGTEHSTEYEGVVEKILSALFYPSLVNPQKQHQIHEGRKRVDITYSNEARDGFFYWVALHYPAAMMFVECKNYGREVGNPEVDQLSGRFSPSRGRVGILVCRSVENQNRLDLRCRDTADDQRGFIVTLTDDDLRDLVSEARSLEARSEHTLLRRKFDRLIS